MPPGIGNVARGPRTAPPRPASVSLEAGRLFEAKRDADIYEAHARGLKARVEIVTVLKNLSPEICEAVIQSYGAQGYDDLCMLFGVSRQGNA